MKKLNILILDDNFVIGHKVKKRLFTANSTYKDETGFEIFPFYIEIDNVNPKIASKEVNNFVRENNIQYLLLDRGFGELIEPQENNELDFDVSYIYRNMSKGGFKIEQLLSHWKQINNNSLKDIKGLIVYTYDDYFEADKPKQGEVIKEEIINKLDSILPSKCKFDVLLAYSNIYKIANVDLYEGYNDETGIIKLGKKNGFLLYGIFVGELLYHKLIQMTSVRSASNIKSKKTRLFYRLIILYLIFISLNLGSSAIFSYLFEKSNLAIGLLSLFFGIFIPFLILLLRPSLLIDIDEFK